MDAGKKAIAKDGGEEFRELFGCEDGVEEGVQCS